MSEFDKFLEEQMKSEEFRREYEALEPDYELVLRGDVDPRNLAFPIKMDGTEYSDYERGYNDGVIAAYWLTRQASKIEAKPVVHARWEWRDLIGDGCSLMLCCSNCLGTRGARETAEFCSECGAKMDLEPPVWEGEE